MNGGGASDEFFDLTGSKPPSAEGVMIDLATHN